MKDYVNKRRQQIGKPPLQVEGDQLPCDDDMKREDNSYRKALLQLVHEMCPELAGSGNLSKKNITFFPYLKTFSNVILTFLSC